MRQGGYRVSNVLGQQTQGTVGARWWDHHIRQTQAYLAAATAKDAKAGLAAVLQLWNAALSWQDLTRSQVAGVLIAEHTVLAKLLIDQAASGARTQETIDALGRNVDAQTQLFPVQPQVFGALFGKHVAITGDYIMAYVAGDNTKFQASFAQALSNGRDLGDFTDRYVLGYR